MSETSAFHGWKVTAGTVQEGDAVFPGRVGYPLLVMSKKDRDTISIVGRPGIDPEILRQRATVDALQQDVEASNPDDRALWEERLKKAIQEKGDAEEIRSLLAGKAAARAAKTEG